MKKKSIVCLSALLLASVIGVGTAAAFLITGASVSGSGKADEAVILKFGDEKKLDAITDLSPTNTMFRELTVAKPLVTTNANYKPVLTLSLTKDETENYSYAGLKVEASLTEFGKDSDSEESNQGIYSLTVGDQITDTAEATNIGTYSNVTDKIVIDLSGITEETTTVYLRISISEAAYNNLYLPVSFEEEEEKTQYNLGATLTASFENGSPLTATAEEAGE